MKAHDALLAIYETLNEERQWSPETLEIIAMIVDRWVDDEDTPPLSPLSS